MPRCGDTSARNACIICTSGTLVAQGMTRVSEKGRPTPCKVLRLEDLPPFGHPLGAGTLLIDAPLRVSQLTSKDEPGQDTS